MSKEYAQRLKEFSETNGNTYQAMLDDYQNDIIDRFGGLDAMIQLCLTNDQFSTDAYKSQFESFQTFMESKHIGTENECANKVLPIDPHQATVGDKNEHNNVNRAILPNLEEFYKYSLGLVAYYSDNLYFTYLSQEKAKYICDHVLATKMYPICLTSIAVTFAIAGQVCSHLYHDKISYSLMVVSFSIATFLSLSYIFSANISIVKFIIQTFDFWYKMFNLIAWIISGYFVSASVANFTWVHTISSLTVVCVYILLFVLDATCISNRWKNMFIVSVVSYGIFVSLDAYFLVDDKNFNWNPFKQYNFKYSQINFKSTFISSQLNLCLFILKPIFAQINVKIRNCIQNSNNINTGKIARKNQQNSIRKSTKDGLLVQRSYILYKRPYIHWVVDSNSQLIGMGKPEIRLISVNKTATQQLSIVAVHSETQS